MSSLRSYEDLVREFHRAFWLPVRDTPDVGIPGERVLRVRLMLEELLEFAKAAGVKILVRTDDYLETIDELEIFAPKTDVANLPAMAHELADLQYVVSGSAVQLGIPIGACVKEIHKANMRKLGPDGRPIVDENGKVRKPKGWEPANAEAVLAAHAPTSYVCVQCGASDGCEPTCSTRGAPCQSPGCIHNGPCPEVDR